MKVYINKINKMIMLFLYSMVVLFVLARIVNPYYEGLGAAFFGIIALGLLWFGNGVTYYIDDTKIERKYFIKRAYAWEDVREVTIGDWYIKLTSEYGSVMKIAKKKNQENIFIDIKDDVLNYVSDEKIKYDEDGSEEGLKLTGGVLVMFIMFILQIFVIGRTFIISLIGAVIMDKSDPYVLIILSLLLSIGAIIWIVFILIKTNKRKLSAVMLVKLFMIYSVIAYSVPNFYIQQIFFESEIMLILGVAINVLYLICIAGVYIVYINDSERAKHYFVK